MATFIRVTRDQSGDVIYVNMDKITSVERNNQKNHTILKSEIANELVKETLAQIIDLIRIEKKIH